ncbi:MAG TPA: hypothetical protein VLU46_02025 [Thermoanaerobaculia bacterium]|nr:hypothetical protein [Thermoanaerobaculia bacterium]
MHKQVCMAMATSAKRCRAKFLRFFAEGFRDETYIDWERGYKWTAHEQWEETVRPLLEGKKFEAAAEQAARIESRTNLLFSFEKMALRDAIKTGARTFGKGLYDFLKDGDLDRWIGVVESLPRKQTRVLTWPVVTVWGMIAQPEKHIFLKPNVTKIAAREYGFEFEYRSRPNLETYTSLKKFASLIRRDQKDLKPRDMIDLQSFMWVQGSDEYEE